MSKTGSKLSQATVINNKIELARSTWYSFTLAYLALVLFLLTFFHAETQN